jgi:hypothetical protein
MIFHDNLIQFVIESKTIPNMTVRNDRDAMAINKINDWRRFFCGGSPQEGRWNGGKPL